MIRYINIMPTKYVDYLKEDEPIPGQSWVCISLFAPEMEKIKNCSMRGIKIRGVFSKKEDADAHAKKLHDSDPDFDVYVGEVGKWLPWDPNPDDIEKEVHPKKELNTIMANYKRSRQKAKEVFDERKEQMMKEIELEENDKARKVRNRLKRKLRNKLRNKNKDVNKLDKIDEDTSSLISEDAIKEMMDKIKEKEEELIETKKTLLDKQSQLDVATA